MKEYSATEKHILNEKYEYQRRQIKDSIEGTTSIKSSGTLYLPMPSSFMEVESANVVSVTGQQASKTDNQILQHNLPHYHNNPAYMAYLQRARFPGFTANILRGLLGLVGKYPPEIELPDVIKYMEDGCTLDGKSLEELFYMMLNGVFTDGKFAIVVDFKEDGTFYFSPYCAEANINWQYGIYENKKTLMNSSFKDESDSIKEFKIDPLDGTLCVTDYNENNEEISSTPLTYVGKPIKETNVFYAGSIKNEADSFVSPLLGISDCALEIYQIHADLRQAEYLTCNPTLFIFGLADNEKPKTIGSQVMIAIRNPQGRAEYPNTDTSALSHLRERIKEIQREAAEMGINFITGSGIESAEALSLKQSNKGTNLIHCVNLISKAINDAFKFIFKLKNIEYKEEVFIPNVEFIEMVLQSQDIQALVAAWVQGAIPQDIVLDNLREARYIKPEDTNEKIMQRITVQPPSVSGGDEKEKESEDNNSKDKINDKKE